MRPVTPLELIDIPYAFAQRDLLSASEFADEAKKRGVDLDLGQLEAFHRAGILIPLYASRGVRPPWKSSDASGHGSYRELRDAGDLVDPRKEGFRPWRRFRHLVDGYAEPTRSWLYSQYQLLALSELRDLQRYLHRHGTAATEARYELRRPKSLGPLVERPPLDLIALFTWLEPIYLPRIVSRVVGRPMSADSDEWFRQYAAFRRSFDPQALLAALDCTAVEIRETAERLLVASSFDDPLRAWVDLVRQMHPDRWFELRGSALLSIDRRIAAELILRLYDDLVALNQAEPLPKPAYAWHPLLDRLDDLPLELDPLLTHYGLSPHPAVLVVAEGESDRIVLRRTLDLLRVPRARAFIDIVSSGGNNQSYAALIASIAPEPGLDLSGAIVPRRPVTRILRVLDKEANFSDETALKKEHRNIVTQLEGAWRMSDGPALAPGELASLVEVTTWGRLPMEFANFTDAQVARVISDLTPAKPKLSAADISAIRASARPGPQFRRLLARRGLDGKDGRPGKVELAEELARTLRRKVERDARRGRSKIPAVVVVRRAIDLALRSPRRSTAFRKAEH